MHTCMYGLLFREGLKLCIHVCMAFCSGGIEAVHTCMYGLLFREGLKLCIHVCMAFCSGRD